jgi:hypothetical protein
MVSSGLRIENRLLCSSRKKIERIVLKKKVISGQQFGIIMGQLLFCYLDQVKRGAQVKLTGRGLLTNREAQDNCETHVNRS